MELTFLGTGAGDGYPSPWCQCPNCHYARTHGGKNLRAHSSAVIDGEILLDMSPGFFEHAARFGLDVTQAHTLLFTHSHGDHYDPNPLFWRRPSPQLKGLPPEQWHTKLTTCCTPLPLLTIYGNRFMAECLELATEWSGGLEAMESTFAARFVQLEAGIRHEGQGFSVTPILGVHGSEAGFAFSYILERNGKTLLYALDTGDYAPDQLAILAQHRYDCVIMEGTFGLCAEPYEGHMNTEQNRAWKRYFDDNSLWKGAPRFVLSHMSPHWNPPHDQYAPMMAAEGITVAYDGMVLSI